MDTDRYRDCSPPGSELFEDLEIHLVGLPAAAPFRGVGQREQTKFAECAEDIFGVGLGLFVLVDDRGENLVGDVCGQLDQFACFGRREEALDGHSAPCH